MIKRFFKPKISTEQLQYKAAAVTYSLVQMSKIAYEGLADDLNLLPENHKEEEGEIIFILYSFFLLQAQKFFWERGFIKDEQAAHLFEETLYEMAEKLMGVSCKAEVKEIIEYIKKIDDPSREFQYVGAKICNQLNVESAILSFEINSFVANFIAEGGFESLKNSFELPEKIQKELYDNIVNL